MAKVASKPAKTTVTKKITAQKTAGKKTAAKTTAAKTTAARKVPARRAPAAATAYPFPFLGAGAASYFEFGEIVVWFAAPVPTRARAAIKRAIPAPFRRSVDWEGPILYAGNGDQFINFHITQAYPRRARDREEPDYEDGGFGDERDMLPSSDQSARFEADIVTWLRELHAERPIALVLRREDSEAGGTHLDRWHRWSAQHAVEHILPLLEPFPPARDSIREYAIGVCMELLQTTAPAIYKAIPARYRRAGARR